MSNNAFNQPRYVYGGDVRNAAGLDPRNIALGQPQWTPVPQPVVVPQVIKGRPVSSIEEARAAQIDLDGSIHVFPDWANKKIYTKSINIDGTASFSVYVLDESGRAAAAASYVTHAELEDLFKRFTVADVGYAPAAAQPAQSSQGPAPAAVYNI